MDDQSGMADRIARLEEENQANVTEIQSLRAALASLTLSLLTRFENLQDGWIDEMSGIAQDNVDYHADLASDHLIKELAGSPQEHENLEKQRAMISDWLNSYYSAFDDVNYLSENIEEIFKK